MSPEEIDILVILLVPFIAVIILVFKLLKSDRDKKKRMQWEQVRAQASWESQYEAVMTGLTEIRDNPIYDSVDKMFVRSYITVVTNPKCTRGSLNEASKFISSVKRKQVEEKKINLQSHDLVYCKVVRDIEV